MAEPLFGSGRWHNYFLELGQAVLASINIKNDI